MAKIKMQRVVRVIEVVGPKTWVRNVLARAFIAPSASRDFGLNMAIKEISRTVEDYEQEEK